MQTLFQMPAGGLKRHSVPKCNAINILRHTIGAPKRCDGQRRTFAASLRRFSALILAAERAS
jgi:hypothetical protein